MSAMAYDNIFVLFQSACIKVIKEIKPKDVIVEINKCFLTGSLYLEYHFHKKEKLEEFLQASNWYDLPMTHHLGIRYFNVYENGKFIYDKERLKKLVL